jgi:two-component system, OmpR family, sensor histidine kinase CpxA
MTIFQRTFLSFWIATVLIALISMGMVAMTHPENRMKPVSVPLPDLRACAVKTLQAADATRSAQQAAQCGIILILDSAHHERLASGASEVAHSLAGSTTAEMPFSIRPLHDRMMVAFDIPVDNQHFVAVAILATKMGGPPPFLWWQFIVAVVVSAVTCLALTRHFVAPIRKLQWSTESFGRGELQARPDASLLDRNDELGELSQTIGQMSARISRLLSSQKNFLIQVSHELGSPLTRLNVALALARRRVGAEIAPELDRIQKESSELNSMVQQLLSLARLESGLEREGQEWFSLHDLMVEVCIDNQLIADESFKELHVHHTPEIQLRGYRELLKRAVDNVLRNAIRFTPQGSYVEVEVERGPDGKTALIQVRDGGSGVQEDRLDAIFEPFVRGSSDRSGAGLGLAIAKRAVLANQGTIRAINLKEGGLLIEISLPCVSNHLATARATAEQEVSE